MSERKANRGAVAAAAIVALSVAGLWFLLGDDPDTRGPADAPASHSEPTPTLAKTTAQRRKISKPLPSAEASHEKPHEGTLEVEVFSGNKPLPGAQLQVYERVPADLSVFPSQWSGKGSGETGAEGRWELPVAPGNYYVTARAQGLAPSYATVVQPSGSTRTHVKLLLEEGQELVGFLLSKESGLPVSLAEVLLMPPAFTSSTRDLMDGPEEETLVATSNASGEFRFSGIAPGRYRIEARAPGYVTAVLPSAPVPFKGRVTLILVASGQFEGTVVGANGQPAPGAEVLAVSWHDEATVFADNDGHFSFELSPGSYGVSARRGEEAGALQDKVTITAGQHVQGLSLQLGAGAWVSGKVVRQDGSPIIGARVEAQSQGLTKASGQAGTDKSGAFSIPALAPGTYVLQAVPPDGHLFGQGGITLAAGEHASVTLTAQDKPHGSIGCQVKDAAEHPVPGVVLRVSPLQAPGTSDSPPKEGRTDTQGRYYFNELPSGAFRVEALREGQPLTGALSVLVPKDKGAGCLFRVPSETTPEGALSTVEGQVLQGSGSPPDTPVLVEFVRQDKLEPDPIRALVDAQGQFKLTVSPGSYTLRAFRQRRTPCSADGHGRQLQLEAGQHVETSLLLEEPRESELKLRLVDANGAPVKLTPVKVYAPARFSTVAQTDEEGRLDVCLPPTQRPPPPAAPLLVLSTFDSARAAKIDSISGSGELTLQLLPLPSVEGRIISAHGAPVNRILLDTLSPALEHTETHEFVGERFQLPSVPVGPTQLLLIADGMKASVSLDLQPGEHKVLEIPVYPGSTLRGRLLRSDTRQPLEGIPVSLLRIGDQLTDSNGRFSFTNLPPGEFILEVGPSHMQHRVRLSPEQDTDMGDIGVSLQ